MRQINDSDLQMIFDFNADLETLRFVPRAPFAKRAEAIGYGGLFDIDAASSKAEIGYGLLQQFWGKGYVSEAVAEISRFGSNDFGLHRIYGQVDPENAPWARVLPKLSYVKEGCLRDDIFARGRFLDMDIFALINPDNRPATE